MTPSVTAGLRSPVTVSISVLAVSVPVLALFLSRSYDLPFASAYSAFVPVLSVLAPFAGAAVFLSRHRARDAGAAALLAGTIAPSLAILVPLLALDPISGIAFATFPVFFSRAALAAAVSSRLARAGSSPAVSSLAGFLCSLAGWLALGAVADRAGHPPGGFVSASQGLLPASETLAAIACSVACAWPLFAKAGPTRLPIRFLLSFAALAASLAFLHVDCSLDGRSSISKQGSALLDRLDSELLLTAYTGGDALLTPGERASVRQTLRAYASRGKGLFRYEEVPPLSADSPGRAAILEYRGTFRELPPADSSLTFEHDLCVAIAALLGDDVLPEVILLSDGDDARTDIAGRALLRAGYHVSREAIPERRFPGKVVMATGVRSEDIPRLRGYLDSGGPALFAVSGVSCDVLSSWTVTGKERDPLLLLLSEYGAKPSGDLLATRRGSPLRMPSLDGSSLISVRYPFWITAVPAGESRGSANGASRSVLAGVHRPLLLWPSSIELGETEGVSHRILLTASGKTLALAPPVDAQPLSAHAVSLPGAVSADGAPVLVSLSINSNRESVLVLSDEQAIGFGSEFADTSDTLRLVRNCLEFLSGKDEYAGLRRGR